MTLKYLAATSLLAAGLQFAIAQSPPAVPPLLPPPHSLSRQVQTNLPAIDPRGQTAEASAADWLEERRKSRRERLSRLTGEISGLSTGTNSGTTNASSPVAEAADDEPSPITYRDERVQAFKAQMKKRLAPLKEAQATGTITPRQKLHLERMENLLKRIETGEFSGATPPPKLLQESNTLFSATNSIATPTPGGPR
jgi:hypothetical protein